MPRPGVGPPASLFSALSLQRCPSLSSLLTRPATSGMWTPARLAPCRPGEKGGPPHRHALLLWDAPPPWACFSPLEHTSPLRGTLPQTGPLLLGVALPRCVSSPKGFCFPPPPIGSCGLTREGFLVGAAPLVARPLTQAKCRSDQGHQETLSFSGALLRPLVPPQPCCLLEVVAWLRLLSGPCMC